MSVRAQLAVLVVLLALGVGSMVVAGLALAHLVDPWGVLFFYTLPAIVFFAWTAGELAPRPWRRAVTPMRRRWRHSRLAAPPAPPAPERSVAPPRAAGAPALGIWMVAMRRLLDVWRTPRTRRLVNAVFTVSAIAILVLAGSAISRSGWPFARTRVDLAAATGALFLSTFALKALGWQRLFRPSQRPPSLALAAGSGAACVTGLALPSRFDDAARLAIVHRLAGRRPSIGTLAASLFILGLVDAGALAPFSVAACLTAPMAAGTRIVLALVAVGGVGSVGVLASLPRIRRRRRWGRHRLTRWLDRALPGSAHDAAWAWLLIAASWGCRAAGLVALLEAVRIGPPVELGLGYLTISAAAGALPIGPAGAATQAGLGAAALISAGIDTQQAVAFAVTAQLLTAACGALVAAYAGILRAARRLRRSSPRRESRQSG